MSLRAEVLRLALRLLVKTASNPAADIARHRRLVAQFERLVPRPPPAVEEREAALGGVPALRTAAPSARSDRHILYLHGGGYVAGSARLYRHIAWRIAAAAGAKLIAVNYRLAPEHPFPAALDDAVAAWCGLLREGGQPGRAVVMGDSAGGGLAFAATLRLRDERTPIPAAIVALSPWTDLAATGASLDHNASEDPMQNWANVPSLARLYLAGADPCDPYASPLYGDPVGLPPALIQVGSDEILRDDAVRMAERMQHAGQPVTLEIWPRMPHVWHAFAPLIPEAMQAITRIGTFVRQHTGGD